MSDKCHPEDACVEHLANGLALLDSASEHLDADLREKLRGVLLAIQIGSAIQPSVGSRFAARRITGRSGHESATCGGCVRSASPAIRRTIDTPKPLIDADGPIAGRLPVLREGEEDRR